MHYLKIKKLSTPLFLGLSKTAANICDFFMAILFPQYCLGCKKEGTYFCSSCRCKIPPDTSPIIHDITSLWQYDNEIVKKIITELKYRGKRDIARDIAESLYDKLLETLSEDELYAGATHQEKYLIIPIPLHKIREKERGYNQSELLAKELCLLDPSIFTQENSVLFKEKHTKSQVSVKDREERLKNINGSFGVKNVEKIKGKLILVLDDVTTTGATLAEARRLLIKAGAKKVLCVTVAH